MDKDSLIEILQVIVRNPIRTLLASIGVGWGMIMLILMIGAGNGLENGVKQEFEGIAKNSMYMWTMSTTKAYAGFQPGRRFELNNGDVEFLKHNVPEMAVVSPRNQLGGYRGSNNVVRKGKTGAFNIYGDYPEYIQIEPVIIRKGRYINHGDMQGFRKVCILGEEVVKMLFESDEDPLGENVQINGISFKVVGVFGTVKSGEDGLEELQSIFVPFATFQKSFNTGDEIGWLSMLSREDVPVNVMQEKVLETLKARKSVHPDDQRAFGSWTLQERMEEINLIFGAFDIVGFSIGVLVLLAGIIGIINIMLITVNERTKEFGIRRSLGATPRKIVSQLMSETLLLTLVSGCVGVGIGVGLLELLNLSLSGMGDSGAFRNPGIGWKIVCASLGVMVFFGAIAGLLPAFRAVTVRPVDALRAEL